VSVASGGTLNVKLVGAEPSSVTGASPAVEVAWTTREGGYAHEKAEPSK